MKTMNVTSPKQPMGNQKTALAAPKYTPNGSGASKSEGPISKQDTKLCK